MRVTRDATCVGKCHSNPRQAIPRLLWLSQKHVHGSRSADVMGGRSFEGETITRSAAAVYAQFSAAQP
jgi:hypothetical protein